METNTEEKVYSPLWENYLEKLDDLGLVEKTKWMKIVDPLVELPFVTKNYFPLSEREFLDKLESDESFKKMWGQN
jgi:hypothetical protein